MPRLFIPILFLTLASNSPRSDAESKPTPPIHTLPPLYAPALAVVALDQRMTFTKLPPSKKMPALCHFQYRVATASPECQAFVDQSLGFYYSYVFMEAARSAETAIRHDPDCAYAWFSLSRSLEKWGKADSTKALERAKELMPKASQREQLLIQSKLQEKGMWPGVGPDERKKKAAASLDELLTLYGEDEEGWFARAQLNGGTEGVVYYKALLHINPIHPGASHELVHFYENYKRPALGWPFAEAYIASSPGIPHAFHMQSHLAMRIGKWEKTTDWSTHAVELEKAYHRAMDVKPGDDAQFDHHLETLTRSLIHDGRLAEAKALKYEHDKSSSKRGEWPVLWFRLYRTGCEWEEAQKIVAETRKGNKGLASYYASVMALDRGDTKSAAAEIDVLRQEQQRKKADRDLEQRLWEVQGRLMCQQGSGEPGLKLMQRAVDKTKDNFAAHAWGHGAYFMEQWGIGALEAGNAVVAEEAFLEALAHDSGSVYGALGMRAICERQGRSEEAKNFGLVAERCWHKADRPIYEMLKEEMMKKASTHSFESRR